MARTEARLTADLNVLEQKIALVTGGLTGIGLAWVIALCNRAPNLVPVVLDRRAQMVQPASAPEGQSLHGPRDFRTRRRLGQLG